jgi:hypothetical protein
MGQVTAIKAAKQLAADLNLPSRQGSVFVWHTPNGPSLVIAADRSWLVTHRTVPHEYLGYPVEARDRFEITAERVN